MFKKIITLLLFATLTINGFSQTNFNIWRAGKNIDRGNVEQAKKLYEKALQKNKESYKANLGMGLLLSETIEDYANALPYLEKIIRQQNKDTVADLIYALAKCYQYDAQFNKALVYFNRLDKVKALEDDNKTFKKDIEKRKIDCKYALANYDKIKISVTNDMYVVNLGNAINTDAPEYVPVLNLQSELLFTSKRKDDKHEKLNLLNSQYFESMYVSKYQNGKFEAAKHYTLADVYLNSTLKNGNESVVSITGDGKNLFVYRNGQIYQTPISELEKTKPTELKKTIKFNYYQSHAFLTKDGNNLYFTSDINKGLGGNDIYKSTKTNDGVWSAPENLGVTINTEYDEDAPFLSDDGLTLYFASKGHQGFGNYDIFKSKFENGKWTTPENLGQPINSTGNDIFLTHTNKQLSGYFSSQRAGGFGDMDIYKVNYFTAIDKTCPTTTTLTSLSISDTEPDDFRNNIEVKFKNNYKGSNFEWQINGLAIGNNKEFLNYDYVTAGNYTISVKTIAYCDTCLEPIVACNTVENKFIPKKVDTVITQVVDLKTTKGELNKQQLKTIGFDLQPVYFDLKQNTITTDAEKILQSNIAILKQNPTLCVQLIVGYNKKDNKNNSNLKLSKARAESVKKYLLKNSVNPKQILKLISKSESDIDTNSATTTNTTTEPAQQTRRVIFKVINN